MTEAAILAPYSAEYLSLRARSGKLKAVKIHGVWHTTADDVLAYMKERFEHDRLKSAQMMKALSLESEVSAQASVPKSLPRAFDKDVIASNRVIKISREPRAPHAVSHIAEISSHEHHILPPLKKGKKQASAPLGTLAAAVFLGSVMMWVVSVGGPVELAKNSGLTAGVIMGGEVLESVSKDVVEETSRLYHLAASAFAEALSSTSRADTPVTGTLPRSIMHIPSYDR